MFFLGLHHPDKARWVDRAFISANVVRDRVAGFCANEWVLDSGAFTEISTFGEYRSTVREHAAIIRRFAGYGTMLAAVAQDYMCEPQILTKTGLTIRDHQRLTIERYKALMGENHGASYILPVVQGFLPADYVRHIGDYGDLLPHGAWVGVGSICKRQGRPREIASVFEAIHEARPDLLLHGFGVKLTSLRSPRVTRHLYSADSMAWSFAARRQGGDQNSLHTALDFETKVLQATGWPAGDFTTARQSLRSETQCILDAHALC